MIYSLDRDGRVGLLQKSLGRLWGKIVGNEGCRDYRVPKPVASLGGVVPSCFQMSDYLLVLFRGRVCVGGLWVFFCFSFFPFFLLLSFVLPLPFLLSFVC